MNLIFLLLGVYTCALSAGGNFVYNQSCYFHWNNPANNGFTYLQEGKVVYSYFKENGQVYHYDHLLEGADFDSFQIGRFTGWARDKHYVYYDGKRIEGADPGSFNVFDSIYTMDKNAVFIFTFGTYKKSELDRATFRKISHIYSKDKEGVYAYWDSKHYKIEGADPESFEVTPENAPQSDARDKFYSYREGQRI